jgi:hypothetical protein
MPNTSLRYNILLCYNKNTKKKKKQFVKSWIFYPKFIRMDGHQILNVNVLTLFYSLILYFNILFSKHSKSIIIKKLYKSNGKTKKYIL